MSDYSDKDSEQAALAAVRDRIDAIDARLVALISERAECAKEVAEIKLAAVQHSGESAKFYRPDREAQVLRAIRESNPGPLAGDDLARIFREIMSSCLALEQPLTVAYLGPAGTYSQAASYKHFGQSAVTEAQTSIPVVFRRVEDRHCDYGVVPVENSTEGMIGQTLDAFLDSPLQIVGEIDLPIVHHLLGPEGTQLSAVDCVCGHEQALGQCRNWLDAHLAQVPRKAVTSNGEAARLAAETTGMVAIAGDLAAATYGLTTVVSAIQDQANNTTRFFVLGKEGVPSSGLDKTAILVASRNRPGALLNLLKPFSDRGISLTRIDSRPSRSEKWTYIFFIEFEGHQQDAQVREILSNLEEHSIMLKVLGSYPKAPI